MVSKNNIMFRNSNNIKIKLKQPEKRVGGVAPIKVNLKEKKRTCIFLNNEAGCWFNMGKVA